MEKPRKPRKPEDLYVLDAFKTIGKTDDECDIIDFGEVRALALLICARVGLLLIDLSCASRKVFKGKEQAAQTDKVKRHP